MALRLDAGGGSLSAAAAPAGITGAAASADMSSAAAVLELEKDAFQLLNVLRAEKGLHALKWNNDIAKVARLHSQNMASYKFFSHKGVDGLMVDARADKLGLSSWRAIGENIAYMRGFQNPVETAVEKWMLSTSHRQNVLNTQWIESAVGVAITGDGTYYFTQVFLTRK